MNKNISESTEVSAKCGVRSAQIPACTTHRAPRTMNSGFTLAELMISITILALIITFASQIYVNFFGSVRNLRAANTVYEEARFVMERITNEIRNGTIDYEEYYNQNLMKQRFPDSYQYLRNETYAQNYCQYSRQFYDLGADDALGTADDEHVGRRQTEDQALLASGLGGVTVDPAIGSFDEGLQEDVPDPIQDDLFIININGDRRSYIKKISEADSQGNPVGRIGLLKLSGQDLGIDHLASDPNAGCQPDDGENDGRVDSWTCDAGYPCKKNSVLTPGGCSGTVDTVVYDPNTFTDNSFKDITPAALDIVDLKFIVSPMDDPLKAYNTPGVQIQPNITVRLVARASKKLAASFSGEHTPDIVLESTVSARVYNEIVTECNVKQCSEGISADIACPLNAGVCSGATQACTNSVWPGCFETDYKQNALDNFGNANLYQEGSEFASCAANDNSCKQAFCTDGYDNDCSGAKDKDDPICKYYLCNNGTQDSGEKCLDVGDICEQIRPYESGVEMTCGDGYDNDCDGKADELDPDCILEICSNGLLDKNFVNVSQNPPNYLSAATRSSSRDETCIDVGGICGTCVNASGAVCACNPAGGCNYLVPQGVQQTGGQGEGTLSQYCYDGIDNDCDGKADEFDDQCLQWICNDAERSCHLAPPQPSTKYASPSYLGDYIEDDYVSSNSPTYCANPGGIGQSNDEFCKNVGGICDYYRDADSTDPSNPNIPKTYIDHTYLAGNEASPTNHSYSPEAFTTSKETCTDKLDNDCDGKVDWQDDQCCMDDDQDGIPGESFSGNNSCFPDSTDAAFIGLDCNDYVGSGGTLKPGATEVCNDLVYTGACTGGICTFPVPFPADPKLPDDGDSLITFPEALLGTPIDNNCSAVNDTYLTVDDGWDHQDPQCCVDTDGDGFGAPSAYLYISPTAGFNGPCTRGGFGSLGGPRADCDDTSASVNPDAVETGASCFSEKTISGNGFPLNENCSVDTITYSSPAITTAVPRANHIDWYRDKDASWLSWYSGPTVANFNASGTSKSGIAMAAELNLFDPACCTGAYEICDDNTYGALGSDENCNGLEGAADRYCADKDGFGFTDNFTSTAYLSDSTLTNPIVYDATAGVISVLLPTDAGTVSSDALSPLSLSGCPTSYQVTLNPTENKPAGTVIRYQVSSNGGTTWCGNALCDGSDYLAAGLPRTLSGSNLMWRAELIGDGGTKVPLLEAMRIDITNCN